MKRVLLPAIIFLISISAFAQGTYVPLGGDTYDYTDRLDIKYGKILPMLHTGTKPYLRSEVTRMAETLHFSNLKQNKVNEFQLQYLMDDSPEWLDSVNSKTRRPLFKKLYREPASFAHVESKKKGLFDLRINPQIDLHLGGESKDGRFNFYRDLGVEFRGNIKKVLSFYVSATGGAERAPKYVSLRADDDPFAYVSGEAYYKNYSSKIFKFNDGSNWFDARGYVNVNVLDYLNITFGRDKHFWGNGQRSLFLSDNSAPMLFLKYKLSFWRIEYISMITQLTNPDSTSNGSVDGTYKQKYGAFHKLNIKFAHWLDVGLFEGVITRRAGNNLDPSYLNPIIFYRAVEHALGSPDNEFIGADFKANAFNHMSIYGQLLLDEFNVGHMIKGDGWRGNKYGLQLGVKYIDIVTNLDGQVEFNMVRPFTYSHPEDLSYSNYNQPLGHPLGSNFYEFIAQLHYQPKARWTMNLKLIVAKVGEDTTIMQGGSPIGLSNFGGDILRTDPATKEFGNHIGQGAAGTLAYINFRVSYQPWHNIYVDLETFYRNKSSSYKAYSTSTFYFGVGVRMNLAQRKYDF
jgi:hypothetical protein